MFSRSYIQYELETLPVKWVVWRRYSDFEWLRTTLCRMNPHLFVPLLLFGLTLFKIPPMAPKESRSFDEDFIERRTDHL